jgi:hypothetical protein
LLKDGRLWDNDQVRSRSTLRLTSQLHCNYNLHHVRLQPTLRSHATKKPRASLQGKVRLVRQHGWALPKLPLQHTLSHSLSLSVSLLSNPPRADGESPTNLQDMIEQVFFFSPFFPFFVEMIEQVFFFSFYFLFLWR